MPSSAKAKATEARYPPVGIARPRSRGGTRGELGQQQWKYSRRVCKVREGEALKGRMTFSERAGWHRNKFKLGMTDNLHTASHCMQLGTECFAAPFLRHSAVHGCAA